MVLQDPGTAEHPKAAWCKEGKSGAVRLVCQLRKCVNHIYVYEDSRSECSLLEIQNNAQSSDMHGSMASEVVHTKMQGVLAYAIADSI